MSGVEDASARPDMGVERGSDASDRGRMDGDLPFSQCAALAGGLLSRSQLNLQSSS